MLLKLIHLEQLTIKYLLHSQELRTSQLYDLEELLCSSLAGGEKSRKLLAKQAGKIKLLKGSKMELVKNLDSASQIFEEMSKLSFE